MVSYIAILEDDPERMVQMKGLILGHFTKYDHVFFDNAPEIIDWLKTNYNNLALLSLDHDLGLCPRALQGKFDPGDGRDVADFLQNLHPVCPVIIHTSNADGRASMRQTLLDAGWQVHQAWPTPEIDWIENDWLPEVKECLMQ